MILAIALYERNLPGSYHWALIHHENSLSGVVNIHHNVNEYTEDGKIVSGAWRTEHFQAALEQSIPECKFVGCVQLSDKVPCSVSDMDEFLQQYSPDQEDFDIGRATWSCSWWIIRAVQDLRDVGYLDVDTSAMYPRVLARGLQLVDRGRKVEEVPIIQL